MDANEIASLKKFFSSWIDHMSFAFFSENYLPRTAGTQNTIEYEKRGFYLSYSEVFGVTCNLNKFRPRLLRERSLNLFIKVASFSRQTFGIPRIISKRYD